MALISRPVLYGGLIALAGGAFWWASGDSPNAALKTASSKKVAKAGPQVDWTFPASETSVRFDPPKETVRNIFRPLLYVDKSAPKTEEDQLMKLPANMAGGESGWCYTGMVEVNDVKMALLENATSHQAGYVKEGEGWKKSRIVTITTQSIVVAGPDGSEQTVFRFNANETPKPKQAPDPGFRPLELGPALRGQIGPNIEITRDAISPKAISSPTKDSGK